MMRKTFLLILTAATLSSSPAAADSFGCQESAGTTFFQDTLYGLATGAIFSGLYIWSKNDDKGFNRERAFANGTLSGGVFGLGLGIAEISLRNCSVAQIQRRESWGFSLAALPSPGTSSLMSTAGVHWRF